MEISVNDGASFETIDESDAGSVFKLAKVITTSSNRATKQEASDTFFSSYDSYWERVLSPLEDAADQAPVLGLSGTLLGMVAALPSLGAAGGNDELVA